jgi:ABC-2 type transport system permease protein
MRYFVFTKKELLENIRTYKLFIMLVIFLIIGMISPLTAKLMPEILKGINMEGISITIDKTTALDSYTQYFKNTTQMGLIAYVIIYSGMISTELSKGTLIPLLTKGLSRNHVILSKYTSTLIIWTLCVFLSFGVTFGYTRYLYPHDVLSNLILSVTCLWLFGVFLLSVMILMSVCTQGNYGSLLLTALLIGLLFLINIIPDVQKYNPIYLVSNNITMLDNTYEVSKVYPTIIITVMSSILFVVTSIQVFKRKQL